MLARDGIRQDRAELAQVLRIGDAPLADLRDYRLDDGRGDELPAEAGQLTRPGDRRARLAKAGELLGKLEYLAAAYPARGR